MTHGPFAKAFWGGAVIMGGIIPILLLLAARFLGTSNRMAAGVASILALAGVLIFEWCFIMAGQSVPNS